MTNFERIKEMTAEELVDCILGYVYCEVCESEFHIECNPLKTCRDAWLEWLKKEAT